MIASDAPHRSFVATVKVPSRSPLITHRCSLPSPAWHANSIAGARDAGVPGWRRRAIRHDACLRRARRRRQIRCELLGNLRRPEHQTGGRDSDADAEQHDVAADADAGRHRLAVRLQDADPYPFGAERTGYLVTDMDDAIKGRASCRSRRASSHLSRIRSGATP